MKNMNKTRNCQKMPNNEEEDDVAYDKY